MNAKHTPGPWALLFGGMEGDDGWTIASKMQPEFGVVAECWKPSTQVIQDEIAANARLIAAAPALLAACEALMNADHYDHFAARMSDSELAAIKQIKTAIAQAKGDA